MTIKAFKADNQVIRTGIGRRGHIGIVVATTVGPTYKLFHIRQDTGNDEFVISHSMNQFGTVDNSPRLVNHIAEFDPEVQDQPSPSPTSDESSSNSDEEAEVSTVMYLLPF